MNRRIAVAAIALWVVLARVPAAMADDHSHLQVTLVVAPSQPGMAGDILGVYAFEMLPCDPVKAAHAPPGRAWTRLVDGALGFLVTTARANHRERFDGPAAKVVMQRLPLDRAHSVSLGDIAVAALTYCRARLSLARLPARTQPTPLPPLETSVRMARPGGLPPMLLEYSHPFVVSLARPWNANGRPAQLTITLDPAAAKPVLADAGLDAGTLSQKALTLLADKARVELRQIR